MGRLVRIRVGLLWLAMGLGMAFLERLLGTRLGILQLEPLVVRSLLVRSMADVQPRSL
jgi:hypothetical protein